MTNLQLQQLVRRTATMDPPEVPARNKLMETTHNSNTLHFRQIRVLFSRDLDESDYTAHRLDSLDLHQAFQEAGSQPCQGTPLWILKEDNNYAHDNYSGSTISCI